MRSDPLADRHNLLRLALLAGELVAAARSRSGMHVSQVGTARRAYLHTREGVMTHWTESELAAYKRGRLAEAGRLAGLNVERETKADHQAERELQRLCESELMRRGIEYLHLSPRAREKQGWPDLTFCVPSVYTYIAMSNPNPCGTPYAVELKTRTGRLSDAQKGTLGRMQDNGWCVRIVRDFDAFRAILDRNWCAGEKLEGD